MCDYSLHYVATRPAQIEEKLVTTKFKNSITRGFAAVGEPQLRSVCCRAPRLRSTRMSNASRRSASAFSRTRKLDSGWRASGRSTGRPPGPITMRLSFRTGRWCCSRACVWASVLRCCSCPLPPAPNPGRSRRRRRFPSVRFLPDGVRAHWRTPAHRPNIDAPTMESHRHGRWLLSIQHMLLFSAWGNIMAN